MSTNVWHIAITMAWGQFPAMIWGQASAMVWGQFPFSFRLNWWSNPECTGYRSHMASEYNTVLYSGRNVSFSRYMFIRIVAYVNRIVYNTISQNQPSFMINAVFIMYQLSTQDSRRKINVVPTHPGSSMQYTLSGAVKPCVVTPSCHATSAGLKEGCVKRFPSLIGQHPCIR